MNYKTAVIKRNFELAGMVPFVMLGKIAGRIFKLKTKHDIFLFFPSADIGGSSKVNIDVTACIKDRKPLIIFSKKPKNNQFRDLFDIEGVRILDLHKYVDNKLYHFLNFFFRGVLAAWINAAEKPVVFGGESLYFYKIIPHVKRETHCVELCHLDTWFNFSQAFIKYIDYRVFSSPSIKREVEQQYDRNNIPRSFYGKLIFIDNKIDIPPLEEINNPVLEVLFVGRGAPQKRVGLIGAIAKRMYEAKLNVHFSFVGDVERVLPADCKQYCTLYGNINSKEELNKIYQKSDVLILTSLYEGLPIVVMDMMARGKVVISTAVGGIPDYITHLQNGFLITATGEEEIISQAIEYIKLLVAGNALKTTIGQNSYAYSLAHFGGEQFCASYRSVLLREPVSQ